MNKKTKKWIFGLRGAEDFLAAHKRRRVQRVVAGVRRAVSECGEPSGYVFDQHSPALAGYRYGKYPLAYNGCEVIAAYNAMLALGREVAFSDVLAEFELNGLIGYRIFGTHSPFAGKFGTDPRRLKKYFDAHGVEYEILKSESDILSSTERGPAVYVASFVNGGKITRGVHTFAFTQKDGEYAVYNGYRASGVGPAVVRSFVDLRAGGRLIVCYRMKP